MGTLLGYARVSTLGQNAALQHDALSVAWCRKVFTDHVSGAKEDRCGGDPLLAGALAAGDESATAVVYGWLFGAGWRLSGPVRPDRVGEWAR